MPKTSKEIAIYTSKEMVIGKTKVFGNKKWFSEQELQSKLKEAEKRIDEQIETAQQLMRFDIEKKGMYLQIVEEWIKAKQILNDCFGVGK